MNTFKLISDYFHIEYHFFVIKINPVHVSLYQSLQSLQKFNENSCITIYKA